MAANNILVPSALAIEASLKRRNLPTSPKSAFAKDPLTAMYAFLAGVYAKTVAITKVVPWNKLNIDRSTIASSYSHPRNQYSAYLDTLIIASEDEWEELIQTKMKINEILDPIQYNSFFDPAVLSVYMERAGIWKRPFLGLNPDPTLYAYDGTVLGIGFITDSQYAQAWNNLRVPYDNARQVKTYYIVPQAGSSGAAYMNFIGIRACNSCF